MIEVASCIRDYKNSREPSSFVDIVRFAKSLRILDFILLCKVSRHPHLPNTLTMAPKVLVVLTSADKFPSNGNPTGWYLVSGVYVTPSPEGSHRSITLHKVVTD